MQKTSIEWVRNPDGSQGYTFNPITGCLNNCPYCYARKLANGRLKSRYLANENITPMKGNLIHTPSGDINPYNDPFYPRFWEDRLEISHHFRFHRAVGRQRYRDRGIFVCDMSDLFGIGIPEEWTWQVLEQTKLCPNDRFYLLTKQPQNLIKWSPFPDNCWVGVTATDASKANNAVTALFHIKASIKFLSLEPFLDWQPLFPIKFPSHINWVIIGAQTKPYKPPKIEWVQEIVEVADKAGIPVFIKNNLRAYASNLAIYPKMKVGDVGYNAVRQEMPIERP